MYAIQKNIIKKCKKSMIKDVIGVKKSLNVYQLKSIVQQDVLEIH